MLVLLLHLKLQMLLPHCGLISSNGKGIQFVGWRRKSKICLTEGNVLARKLWACGEISAGIPWNKWQQAIYRTSGRLHRFRSTSERRDIETVFEESLSAAEEGAATFPAELKQLTRAWHCPLEVLEHLFHRQVETIIL